MENLIDAIKYAGQNPLFLTAFLAMILLFAFRRAVKTEKGLDLLHDIMKSHLTRAEFAKICNRIINFGIIISLLATGLIALWLVLTKPVIKPVTISRPLEGIAPSIERLQKLKSSDEHEYPFEFVLTNPTDRNLLVTEVRVFGDYVSGMHCVGDIEYLAMQVGFRPQISDQVPSGNPLPGFQVQGTGHRGDGPEIGYPIVGRMYEYCANIGLQMKMPVSVIVEPNSRRIVILNLREGAYGTPKVEYGGKFFLTVGALQEHLVEEWKKSHPQQISEEATESVKTDMMLRAISIYLEKQELDLQFTNKLALWKKIGMWRFEMSIKGEETVLEAMIKGESFDKLLKGDSH